MQVIFNGAVSAQAQAGEPVKVTVTLPDTTTDVLTALTLADKTYSVQKEYDVAGNYSVKSHGDADAKYSAWDNEEGAVPFTITLAKRTGTLVVTLA